MCKMDEEETKIETWDEWEEVGEELNDLKKEMAERIVDKMWWNNDLLLFFGKWFAVDYLVDEWWEDIFNDLLIEKLGVNMISWYAEKLKNMWEEIKEANTKQKLDDLESRIINDLEKAENEEQSWNNGWETVAWAGAVAGSAAAITNENYNPDIEVSVDSAKVWEAKEVSLEKRMEWLFPEWVPQTEKQMKKYIEKIKVPIRTPKWKEKTLKLYVHKKLANEYKAIFQEMFDKWIPVNPDSTACFNWRKMRRWKKMSHHSYWTALDVNWDVNGWVYGKTERDSPYYNDQATVEIWKKHGFYRWGDWKPSNNDPMHFTYMNA